MAPVLARRGVSPTLGNEAAESSCSLIKRWYCSMPSMAGEREVVCGRNIAIMDWLSKLLCSTSMSVDGHMLESNDGVDSAVDSLGAESGARSAGPDMDWL